MRACKVSVHVHGLTHSVFVFNDAGTALLLFYILEVWVDQEQRCRRLPLQNNHNGIVRVLQRMHRQAYINLIERVGTTGAACTDEEVVSKTAGVRILNHHTSAKVRKVKCISLVRPRVDWPP